MKSIKEKAEETQIGYDDVQAPAIGNGFMLGANYVIDEINSLMKVVSDEYPLFQQGTIIHLRLIKLLKQLKK